MISYLLWLLVASGGNFLGGGGGLGGKGVPVRGENPGVPPLYL